MSAVILSKPKATSKPAVPKKPAIVTPPSISVDAAEPKIKAASTTATPIATPISPGGPKEAPEVAASSTNTTAVFEEEEIEGSVHAASSPAAVSTSTSSTSTTLKPIAAATAAITTPKAASASTTESLAQLAQQSRELKQKLEQATAAQEQKALAELLITIDAAQRKLSQIVFVLCNSESTYLNGLIKSLYSAVSQELNDWDKPKSSNKSVRVPLDDLFNHLKKANENRSVFHEVFIQLDHFIRDIRTEAQRGKEWYPPLPPIPHFDILFDFLSTNPLAVKEDDKNKASFTRVLMITTNIGIKISHMSANITLAKKLISHLRTTLDIKSPVEKVLNQITNDTLRTHHRSTFNSIFLGFDRVLEHLNRRLEKASVNLKDLSSSMLIYEKTAANAKVSKIAAENMANLIKIINTPVMGAFRDEPIEDSPNTTAEVATTSSAANGTPARLSVSVMRSAPPPPVPSAPHSNLLVFSDEGKASVSGTASTATTASTLVPVASAATAVAANATQTKSVI